MSTVLFVLVALLILCILIIIHELGHYTAGRLLGFTIVEFSVGMGPVVLKKEKNGISYALRAFPIGGMCQFYGEDQEVKDERCFNAKPVWKRIITVAAGPVMNVLFALILSIAMLGIYGGYEYTPSGEAVPEILEVNADTPAYAGGLQKGDVITVINGKPVDGFDDVTAYIADATDDQLTVTVSRNGQTTDCVLHDFYNAETMGNLIGITITPHRIRYSALQCVGKSFDTLGTVVTETFQFFGRLFQGQVQKTDVAGTVGIVKLTATAVQYGFENVLYVAALISLSLGIMNLLPLPALDGGRLVFMLLELVRGKPIPAEKEGMVHFVGLILLFGLLIFLTYNDITNIISGVY